MNSFEKHQFNKKSTIPLNLKQLIEVVPSGIMLLTYEDQNLKMTYASEGFFDMIGYTLEEYAALERDANNLPLIYCNRQEIKFHLAKCVSQENKRVMVDFAVNHKKGYLVWLRGMGFSRCKKEMVFDIRCSFTDISDIKNLQTALEKEKDRHLVIMETTGDVTFEYDIETDTMYFNEPGARQHYDKVKIENYKEVLKFQKLVHPEDLEIVKQVVLGNEKDSVEIRSAQPDSPQGHYFWKRMRSKVVKDAQGKVIQTVGVMRDINEQKKREMDMLKESQKDLLTGLYNKKWTTTCINQALESDQYRRPGILVLTDIDGFRAVNENLGHAFGDALLAGVGDALCKEIEKNDIVGRIGGDEFVLFMPEVEENQIATRIDSLRRIFEQSTNATKQNYRISCSFGVALYPKDGKTYDTLLEKADIALNAAKLHGRGNWYRYDSHNAGQSYLKSHATGIDKAQYQEKRISFENNVLTNIFEILYETKDQKSAMTLILGILGRYLGVEYVAIYEKKLDKEMLQNTYSWYATEDLSEAVQANTNIKESLKFREILDKNGVYKFDNIEEISNQDKESMRWLGACSGFYKVLEENSWFMGYLSMTNKSKIHKWTDEEYDFLVFVSKIIASCLHKMQIQEEREYESQMAQLIVDSQSIKSYTVNPETYEVLFVSSSTKAKRPEAIVGSLCYKAIMGQEVPCPYCKIQGLSAKKRDVHWQRYNSNWNSWLNFHCHYFKGRDGKDNVLIALDDISNFVDDILYIDKLTGISTFSRFEIDAAEIFEHDNQRSYTIITFDIDEFRYINEVYGFSMGNQILRYIAGGLVNALTGAEVCARITGDVFVALLECDDELVLGERLKKMIGEINAHLSSVVTGLRLNFQIGAYPVKKGESDIGQMLDNADGARKSIKGSRKNGIAFYNKKMGENILKTRKIEARMEEALKKREFMVYLQPKIDLRTTKVTGGEALARWVDDQGKMVMPGEFIPVFESNGFIVELDFYIYEEIFRRFSYRKKCGLKCLPISVNMSRVHLKTGNYVERFRTLAKEYGIDPAMVEIEITETIFMENSDYVVRLVAELHQDGFKISVDDFGSGYSALNMLSAIDVDILKLDRSLCMEENLSSKERIILKNIVSMAKELNLHVLAEGIETASQAEFLKSIQCDSGQGFLFARPMPMDQFYEKLDAEW